MWSVQVRIVMSCSSPACGTSRGLGFRVVFSLEASRGALWGAWAIPAAVNENAVGVAVPEAGGVRSDEATMII